MQQAKNDVYVAFKVYWLTQAMTETLTKRQLLDPASIEDDPRLLAEDNLDHGDFYVNRKVREISQWESSTTFAVNNLTAKRMFPLPDFGHQGPDDPYQHGARKRLGIRNVTIMKPILMHQWHPNGWHGTEEDAQKEAEAALNMRFGTVAQKKEKVT